MEIRKNAGYDIIAITETQDLTHDGGRVDGVALARRASDGELVTWAFHYYTNDNAHEYGRGISYYHGHYFRTNGNAARAYLDAFADFSERAKRMLIV